jgi:hypothetical protein
VNSIPPPIQMLLDKHMTREQQARWRSPLPGRIKVLEQMKEYAKAQRDEVLNPLEVLLNAGSVPDALEVQKLIEHNNHLMNKFSVRNHLLTAYERDPVAFGNSLNVGRDAMREAKAGSNDAVAFVGDVNVISFFFRAVSESAAHKEITCILAELENRDADKIAMDMREIASRFRRLCEEHDLGEPLIYAKWAPTQYAGMNASGPSHVREWKLIREALESYTQ